MAHDDTICAISSATGPADRMVVRASGPDCASILAALLLPPSPCQRGEGGGEGFDASVVEPINNQPRETPPSPQPSPRVQGEGGRFPPSQAARVDLHFDQLSVPAIVYTFVAPHSATGQDIVEFHLPGNPLLARLLLEELLRLGARSAEPGEFTARGFFNAKLDLPQAEAVATLVSAENAAELAAARKSLSGELARRLTPPMQRLAESLALIEAAIDFSEEEIEFASHELLREQIRGIALDLARLLEQSARFERLSHEPSVVLVGRPNAGKSSLMNALVGHSRAVVSDVAGTTRDVLHARLDLPRGPVRLIDVAGLEPASRVIDGLMQDRAAQAIESADVIVQLRDCTAAAPPLNLRREPHLKLASKADLGGQPLEGELPVSIRDPVALARFCFQLDLVAFGESFASDALALNARHTRWIASALETLSSTADALGTAALELIAADLRRALNDLGEVLGQVTPDDVLGKVFAHFCIGK